MSDIKFWRRLSSRPLADIPDMLMRGDIDHALVVATLWRLLYHLKENPQL